MSLTRCLKRLGVSAHEAAIYRAVYEDYKADGDKPRDAARKAIQERLDGLVKERAEVMRQVHEQGGAEDVKKSEQRTDEAAPAEDTVAKPSSEQRVVDGNTLPDQSQAKPGEMSKQYHQFITQIARVFGKRVVVYESNDPAMADGYMKPSDPSTVYLNRNSEKGHLVVFGHELLHTLKVDNPAAYDAIQSVIKIRAESADEFSKTAGIHGDMEEAISDLQGDMFSDTKFWADVFRAVSAQGDHPAAISLGAAVMRTVKKMIRALGGINTFDTSKMVENMGDVRDAITKALATYANDQKGAAQAMDVSDNKAKIDTPQEYVKNTYESARNGPPTKTQMATRQARSSMGDMLSEKRGDEHEQLATGADARGLSQPGGVRGGDGVLAQQSGQDSGAGGLREADGSLKGLPRNVRGFNPSAFPRAAEVAQKYMESRGMPYDPPHTYVKVDPVEGKRVADAFEAMQNDPDNAAVKASYAAMAEETEAQYHAMMETGLKVEFIDISKGDPYKASPRGVIDDVRNNNHMWVFSTRDGFGTDSTFDTSLNPNLAETNVYISGQKALANDLFRAVHDYFGHIKEGVGFRADGEENAWRAHAAMYSEAAKNAMTAETRGQNSWVNWGPFGEFNRTASAADVHYADQKFGLLPDWVVNEGVKDSAKRSVVQTQGTEVPESVDRMSSSTAAFNLARSRTFDTNRDLKLELQSSVQQAAREAGVDLSDFSEATERYLVRVATSEAQKAILENANAIGWYREKVTKALNIAALEHPELNTDPRAKFAFIWALAVTSNGMRVNKNYELADTAYEHWKSTGQLPTNLGQGTAKKAIDNGLRAYNVLIGSVGFDALHTAMLTKSTVSEIARGLGIKPKGEYADTIVYGSAILGPKVGNGFFANLYGHYEQLTIDRWLMRTWGRWTGTMVEVDPRGVQQKTDALAGLIGMLSPRQKEQIGTVIGRAINDDNPAETAGAILRASSKESNRDMLGRIGTLTDRTRGRVARILGPERANAARSSLGDEIRKAGKNLAAEIDGQVEAPRGPWQRSEMRQVFNQVLEGLKVARPNLTMSDLQAVLWYPEKRIYEAAKTEDQNDENGYEDGTAPDYANAAAAHYAKRGVAQSDIDRVIAETDAQLRSGNSPGPAGRGAGGLAGQGGPTAGLRASEKREPFYSALSRGVGAIATRAAPAAGWKDAVKGLVNKGAVKQDEVNWSGVNEWLDLQGGKVTREQVQAYLDANGVRVSEVEYGTGREATAVVNGLEWEDDRHIAIGDSTQYSSYQLPGGKNYRELLLTLPGPDPSFAVDDFIDRMKEKYGGAAIMHSEGNMSSLKQEFPSMLSAEDQLAFAAAQDEGTRVMKAQRSRPTFQSSHWDPKNVLAHVRFNERQDVSGARVLFIEELQSDWGQAGKKGGFAKSVDRGAIEARIGDITTRLREIAKSGVDEIPEMQEEWNRLSEEKSQLTDSLVRGNDGMPNAPFVGKTEAWLGLGLKRMIKYAVDNGFEKVAFVNGEQSADRYDLSKQISKIEAKRPSGIPENKYDITAYDFHGSPVHGGFHTASELEDVVGKDLAKRIVEDVPTVGGPTKTYAGLDLKVGGEGMKAFYDKIVPSVAKDVVRKLGGGAMEDVNIVGAMSPAKVKAINNAYATGSAADIEWAKGLTASKLTQPGFSITDAMRAKAADGVPMFSTKRIVGDSGRQYTPEQRAMFANTGRQVETPSLVERVKDMRKDIGKRVAQGMADQFAPIADITKEGYMFARLSKGSAGAFEAFMHHGKLSIKDGAYDADRTGGVIERVFQPLHGEGEDFLSWIAANRAEQLTKEDRENLFTAADIAAGKSLATGTTNYDYVTRDGKTTRDRSVIYRDTLVTYDEFNKNALDVTEQSGTIDPASRKVWEKLFYVPFYRVMDDSGGFAGANIGQGLVRQAAFKELKGGGAKLNSDLMANVLQNWAHLIDSSAKNRAAKATLEAAAAMGSATESSAATIASMSKVGGNAVWFLDQGVKRHFLVNDPYLLTAIQSLEFAGMKGPLMTVLSTAKHWLTVGVTASPAFKIRNLIRDSIAAVSISGLKMNPIANIVQGSRAVDAVGGIKDFGRSLVGVKAAHREASQTYVSALASGGLIRFGTMLEGRASDRIRQLVKMGVDESTILNSDDKIAHVRNKFEAAFMAYSELGNKGEEINRAALYEQLTSKGMGHAEASLMARDLLDFSMQGSWQSVRFITQVVPFMNARIQGLYKLGKGAKENPARFAAVLGAVALTSLTLLAAYHDDDDWKKREDWDRDNYWWFKVGGIAYRIPKPFEIGAIATLAERGVELFTDKEMTQKRFLSRVGALLSDNLNMNPIPQAVKPIIDIYANKDSFSGRPIETMGMEKLEPQYRFNANTSMVARGLSTGTGGVMSPVQIDHAIQGYFSWVGSMAVGASDMLVRPLTDEPTRPTADYFKMASQGFVSEVPTNQSRYMTELYDQAKQLEQAYGTWRALLKQGRSSEARDFYDDNKDDISKYKSVEAVKAGEARINEQVRIIERSSMDPDQKRDRIQGLREMQDRLARTISPK